MCLKELSENARRIKLSKKEKKKRKEKKELEKYKKRIKNKRYSTSKPLALLIDHTIKSKCTNLLSCQVRGTKLDHQEKF
jgi:hypothetical protein